MVPNPYGLGDQAIQSGPGGHVVRWSCGQVVMWSGGQVVRWSGGMSGQGSPPG